MLGSGLGGFHGPIFLDDLLCDGNESSLLDCHGGAGSHQCTDHNQDAGVKCSRESQCEEQSLLLVSADEWTAKELYLREGDLPSFDFINDEIHRGRVDICMNGMWKSICHSELWNNVIASIACKQLGFSEFGKLIHNESFCIIKLPLGALAVDLESSSPNQHTVQFSGHNVGSLMYGDDDESCESAAGVVCQGESEKVSILKYVYADPEHRMLDTIKQSGHTRHHYVALIYQHTTIICGQNQCVLQIQLHQKLTVRMVKYVSRVEQTLWREELRSATTEPGGLSAKEALGKMKQMLLAISWMPSLILLTVPRFQCSVHRLVKDMGLYLWIELVVKKIHISGIAP